MSALHFILAPVVGGVIGYITNALAIRMLFRPYTPKYFLGMHIPFTPGIIPKEKGRIASSLGTAISDNLMNRDVLERYLLSESMLSRLRTSIDTFCFRQMSNTETLRQFLGHYLAAEDVDRIFTSVRGDLATQISARLAGSGLGEQIADAVARHLTSRLRSEGLEGMLPGILRMLGDNFKNKLADLIEPPLRKFLTGNIDSIIAKDGESMVRRLIDTQVDALADTRMCDLLQGKEKQIQEVAEALVTAYRILISEQLPRILFAIDIPRIIEGRINEMDMRETERLIFAVMNKELQAIIWLGALLGCLMGTINAFV
ncbi:MAG: DUF445 family protein [Muribaculaceae bacterium]|nr:DUF445 family protein [Muribaculaceae bacterium]